MSTEKKKNTPRHFKEKHEGNAVQKNAILKENIKKETKMYNPYENFCVNPFKKMHVFAGKPNSPHDQLDESAASFEHFGQIKKVNREPTEKYDEPQTANQEYGWYPPSAELEKLDGRLYFGNSNSTITKYMDSFFRQRSQEKMAKFAEQK